MKAWLRLVAWEWLQNAGAVTGVLLGAHAWRAGAYGEGLGLGLAGGLLTALVIRWTEERQQPGPTEPWRLTLTNAAGFSVGALFLVWYLARPEPWLPAVDLAAGLALALGVALLQERASAGSPAFTSGRGRAVHRLAFVASFPVTLILMRLGARLAPGAALAASVLINVLLSAVIVYFDYARPAAGGRA